MLNSQNLSELIDEYQANPDNERIKNTTLSAARDIHDMALQGYSFGGMIGASGAVFGILLAAGMLFPNREIMLLFPPIPLKVKYIAFGFGMYALYRQINKVDDDNVAHLAHLGGMLMSFIMLKIWKYK